MQTEVKFSIQVYVYGIKKKCRKSDRHSFKLGYIDYNEGSFDKESVSEQARAMIASNMKTVSSPISVQMLRVEFRQDTYGTMQTFQMFDERHVNFKLDTLLNEVLK